MSQEKSDRSIVDDVVDQIRKSILESHFVPEQHLREEQLAETLGVSRNPVRVALIQMEHEGLVISRRNRGYMVARLSRKDLDEVYSLRLALERLAVQYASYNATQADFDAMANIVRAFKDMANRDISEREAADLDIKYHDLLYRAARHDRLYKQWSSLRSQVHIFLLSRNIASFGSQEMANSHELLLETLRSRNEERALLLIDEHIRWAYLRIVQGYPRLEGNDGMVSFPLFLRPS